MTTRDDDLRPEEFAQAASAAIHDARPRDFREAARVLAEAGLSGVCAAEGDGGLGLPIDFALPIAHAAGKLQLHLPLPETILLAQAFAGTPVAAALAAGDQVATIAWQGSLGEGVAGHARHVAQCDWVLVNDGDGAALVDVAGLACEEDGSLDPGFPQAWLDLEGATVVARLDATARAALDHAACLLMAELANGAADGAPETAAG